MFRPLLLGLLLVGCSSGPIDKEYAYHGEDLSKIGGNGLLVGHAVVPLDGFPHDRKTTIIYFENTKTKKKLSVRRYSGTIFHEATSW